MDEGKSTYMTKYKKILIVKNNISDVFCILNYLKIKFRSIVEYRQGKTLENEIEWLKY